VEELKKHWQIGAAQYLEEPDVPHLRISSASKCPRALAYAMLGTPETEPPDEDAENRMALGHMAEILIIQGLHRRGWETRNTVLDQEGQLDLEVEIPGTGRTIPGHPDGTCRHEHYTKNRWVTLECKSMSPERGQETQERGIAATYPGYMVQIAMYSKKMHDREMVSHPNFGVFAMMDREGRFLPPERVTWDMEIYHGTMEKLQEMIAGTDEEGLLPERPYAPESNNCKLCNYHTACWGRQPSRYEQPQYRKKSRAVKEAHVMEAARRWAESKPVVDEARDVLQIACNDGGKEDIEAEGIVAGYFIPKGQPLIYDTAALRRHVPADILRRCLMSEQPEPKYGFWVRKALR
jgi:CRISPR/Cas system-associated exonuclease Cas4 (RecB family)